jgi:hypothetical protein
MNLRTARGYSFLSPLKIIAVLLACLSSTARAAEPATNDDAAIAAYLSEDTFLVARLDIDRVDPEAFAASMLDFVKGMIDGMSIPAEFKPQVVQASTTSIAQSKTWLADMSEAGAKRVYMIFDQSTLASDDDQPVVVVPLGDNADPDQVTQLIAKGIPDAAEVSQIGQAIVWAPAIASERIKAQLTPGSAPANLPHLAAAMAAGGDAPLRLALIPGEATRAWVEENLPMLPAPIGGGDTKTLSRGLSWASITITQKPAARANLVLQAESAEQAKPLLDLATKGLAFLKLTAAGLPRPKETAEQIDTIKPKLAGEKITFDFDAMLLQIPIMLGNAESQGEGEVKVEVPADGEKGEPKKTDDGGL